MDNSAVIALAAALEMEFGELQRQLKSLSAQSDPVQLEKGVNDLSDHLPALLATAAASAHVANVFASILATNYAEGVAEASGVPLHNAGKLMRPEKAFEAVAASGALRNAPNTLEAAKQDIEVRASALAKVVKGQIVQGVRRRLEMVNDTVHADAADTIGAIAESLEDLSNNQHVNAHVEAQADLARGYGMFSVQQTNAYLNSVQFQEFYRAEHRTEWRNWPERWEKFGGRFFEGVSDYPEGRMIAETGSKIWEDLSNPDHYSDATGSPYPPFAYNSGMSVKPVSVKEAQKLGLLGSHRKPMSPRKLNFNASIRFSADFDDDIKESLLDSMQDWQEKKDEEIVPV